MLAAQERLVTQAFVAHARIATGGEGYRIEYVGVVGVEGTCSSYKSYPRDARPLALPLPHFFERL